MYSLGHISIITNNIEETSRFYQDVLGLKIVGNEETEELKALYLDVGVITIELLESKSSPIFRPHAGPIDHLAFYVDSFDEEYERLKSLGVKMIFEEVQIYDGKKFTFFSGPNGERIEIMER